MGWFDRRLVPVYVRRLRRCALGFILLIVVLILLFGGGGGWYAHQNYGAPGLGGVVGLVIIVLVLLWFVRGGGL